VAPGFRKIFSEKVEGRSRPLKNKTSPSEAEKIREKGRIFKLTCYREGDEREVFSWGAREKNVRAKLLHLKKE